MNKMPPDEWKGFKADVVTAFLAAMLLLVVLIIWLRSDPDPTLINEPCAPGMPIIVDGEKVGCTNDKPNAPPGYYPRAEPE